MRYQVPQFIEIEDKIFGPLTIKQFVYVAGGAGISFVLWKFLPLFIAVLFILPIAALALALAFYKVNGKPFVNILESAVRYGIGNKLYLWKQQRTKKEKKRAEKPKEIERVTLRVPKLSESKLKDLAWSLDIKESVYPEITYNKVEESN